jgi:predicted outer membrane repeat protein
MMLRSEARSSLSGCVAGLGTAVAMLISAPAARASMGFITVNTAFDGHVAHHCSLRDAITECNTGVRIGGCAQPGTTNLINFTVGPIKLLSPLPIITSNIDIEGGVIDGNNTVQMMSVDTGGVLTIGDATLQNGLNFAGAAIQNTGTLRLENVLLLDNNTTPVPGAAGAAITNTGSLVADHSRFEHNVARSLGGAIYNDGQATLTFDDFESNSSSAIYNVGELTISDSSFSGNSSGSYGGAIYNGGSANITDSFFAGNTGVNAGGAIFTATAATPPKTYILNSTFYENSVSGSDGQGGAIDNFSQTLVSFCTFDGNSAPNGAISNENLMSGVFAVRAIIVADSSAANCFTDGPPIFDDEYNISSDASCPFGGTSRNGLDPDLASPGDNGGSTQTIKLLKGSPAIDAIALGQCVDVNGVAVKTDQRGYLRDYPGRNPPDCDIGAYDSGAIRPLTVPALPPPPVPKLPVL